MNTSGFRKCFTDYVVEGFEKNQGFFGKILKDDIFYEQIEGYIAEHIYFIRRVDYPIKSKGYRKKSTFPVECE
ncbi:hypothetical protein C1N76_06595 [Geobacillus thermoleovorans]|uniref:Uncharacterized protein n=1 Tax=Geobacillus thermoleovorans TaxID=33941 RepID=A0A2Z3N5Q8_GEOTH|nr:hypothetical protein C1N76_06595 [Geobacillus thermoleovorans]